MKLTEKMRNLKIDIDIESNIMKLMEVLICQYVGRVVHFTQFNIRKVKEEITYNKLKIVTAVAFYCF